MPGLLKDLHEGWVMIQRNVVSPSTGVARPSAHTFKLVNGNQFKFVRADIAQMAIRRGLVIADKELRSDGSKTYRLPPKDPA